MRRRHISLCSSEFSVVYMTGQVKWRSQLAYGNGRQRRVGVVGARSQPPSLWSTSPASYMFSFALFPIAQIYDIGQDLPPLQTRC